MKTEASILKKRQNQQMQTTFTHLQTLDATPDHALIATYNRHGAHNNPAYLLLLNEQVSVLFQRRH